MKEGQIFGKGSVCSNSFIEFYQDGSYKVYEKNKKTVELDEVKPTEELLICILESPETIEKINNMRTEYGNDIISCK